MANELITKTKENKQFEVLLNQHVKELEVLSNSLVYREKEVLIDYKDSLRKAKQNSETNA